MKIYALRDKLLNYYLQPFAAPEDLQVLGSIANLVNSGDPTGIAQAPQHFEVWRLGEVTADGAIIASKELLADCHALIRPTPGKDLPGVRERGNGKPLPGQVVSPGPAGSSTTQVP